MKNVASSSVRISGGFWQHYEELVRKVTMQSVYDRFRETGRFDALRCDWKEGMPNQPHIYWDSDVAKWIESVGLLCEHRREPELEELADRAIGDIVEHQREDGYFNSYYLTCEPDKIFTERANHELYCAGHLIEAAIAYHRGTGKDALLKAVCRYADYIDGRFRLHHSTAFFTPGHEEIEQALIRLAEYTGTERYAGLAGWFLDNRGVHGDVDNLPLAEYGGHFTPSFWQTDRPVRELDEADGHCVRACYLYTAMAAYAGRTGDREMLAACDRVFDSICLRKLSITGGIGARLYTEGFNDDYRLPNTNNYNETCAAISLCMFASRLQEIRPDPRCADVIERIMYNGMLSGISLSGDSFFYENALEIDLQDYAEAGDMTAADAHRHGFLHPRRLERAKVFSCSCCPPNITRFLASVSGYVYTQEGRTIYCHQFASSTANLTVDGKSAVLEQETDYPHSGRIVFRYRGPAACLAVRVPGWCVEFPGDAADGYVRFELADGGRIEIDFPMEIHFIEANPKVRDDCGRCAVTYGPFVYCMEGRDNGGRLRDIELLKDGEWKVIPCEAFGAPVIEASAQRRPAFGELYRIRSEARERFTARLIPYFTFANRGPDDMLIWAQVR